MLEYLKDESNRTFTENMAVTHRSTLSFCLDLFASIGALRNQNDDEIIKRFIRAYTEDSDIAMKILFYARDIREGLGERRTFRVILRWLAENHSLSVVKNLSLIPEYGRYDDWLSLIDTSCEGVMLNLIKSQLQLDVISETPSLLAKWLPSVNASNKLVRRNAKHIACYLGMDDKKYRRMLSNLRRQIKIIENNLRMKDYTFDYSKQPSKAMFKYRQAFTRNDNERYMKFLQDVSEGKAKLHTGTLAPYEIIMPIFNSMPDEEAKKALDVTWNSLEDFTNGENALAVVDGSGSMYGGYNIYPIAVALSLGIYFAERNKGKFANHFITFSKTPRLVEIKGDNIFDRVQYCAGFNEVANTNIQAVFELILNTAVKHNVSQEEMPSTLYIISDMEFDLCTKDSDMTNFEYAKKIFSEHGYELPRMVFWNADSRHENMPVTQNEQGVCLISGVSPRIFSMIKAGRLSAMEYMLDILSNERYAHITA